MSKTQLLQSFLSPGKAPFLGVKSPTAARYPHTLQHDILPCAVLNNSEQKSVCAYVRSSPAPRRLDMLLVMQIGLRIGEVFRLQWGDFALQNGVLSVRRTVKRIYMAPGKNTLIVVCDNVSNG